MLERIYNYFCGYVTVHLKCSQPERFLNMVVINNIYLWNLKKLSYNEMTFSVSKKGFKALKKIVYEVRAKVKIIKKTGFFMLVRKVKKKKLMVSFLTLSFILIIFLSSLILDIEIIGNESVDTATILEKLQEIGLQKFRFRSNIDSDEISLKLTCDLDDISWVGVYENGTRLTVEIKERKKPPKMIPLSEPCHIVAKKDGIIKKMNVKNGEPLVSLNQIVTKGQVIISGILNSKFDGLRYLHSMGDVVASTWEEEFLKVKLYEYKKSYTGKSFKKAFLVLGGREMDLTGGRIVPYYNFDESVKRHIAGFLEIRIKTYSEYTLLKSSISEEEAISRGKEALLSELYRDYEKELVKKVEFFVSSVDEETRNLRMLASIEEDIGEELKIERNN